MQASKVLGMMVFTLGLGLAGSVYAEGKPVNITPDVMSVTVTTAAGKEVQIQRNQDNNATVPEDFAKTSRPCPPFCIQPDVAAPGVDTIAEQGMLNYLQKMHEGDNSILVIDSRTPDWVERGTIPGAKNLPWTSLSPRNGATTDSIIKIMNDEFGVTMAEGKDSMDVDEAVAAGSAGDVFDFSNAKTLVLFCNGMWCGQSPENIEELLKMGYPPEKLKWYRGGMQDWSMLGLNTVKGSE
ncbi:MAG: rhodanese-like domain-containing protein [Thiolinea sp.]